MAYLYDYNAKFGDQVIHVGDKLLVTYKVEGKNNNIPGHDAVASEKKSLSIDVYNDAPNQDGSLSLIGTITPAAGQSISGVNFTIGLTYGLQDILVYDSRYLIVNLPEFRIAYNGLLNGAIFVYDLNEISQSSHTTSYGSLSTYPKVAIYGNAEDWTFGGAIKLISENGVEKISATNTRRDGTSQSLQIIDIQELLSLSPSTYDHNLYHYSELNNTTIIPLSVDQGAFSLSDGLYHSASTESDRVTLSNATQKIVYEYNTSTGSWGTTPSSTVDLLSEGYTDGSQWSDLLVSDDMTLRQGSADTVTVFNENKGAIKLWGGAGQYPTSSNTETKHIDSQFDISSVTTPVHIVGQNPIPDISLVSGPASTNPTLVNLGIGKVAGVYWNFYSDGTWRVWTYKSSTGTEDRLEYYGNWLSGPMPYDATYSLSCHATEINGQSFSLVQTNGDGRFILEGDNENALVPGVTLAGSGVRPSYTAGWDHISQSEVAAGHLKFTETDPSLNETYSGYAIITFSVTGPPSMLPSENSFRFDYTLADSV